VPRGEDLVHRTGRDLSALRQDRDAVGRLLDLVQDVARDEHGPALAPEAPHQLAHLDDPGRIEPVRRLVQDQDLGVLEEGAAIPSRCFMPSE
jgi:hypothetical protein